MKTTRNPPWADLHPELISAIADLLTSNPIDIRNFRAVCKSWYSSSPPLSPLILSPNLPSYGWALKQNRHGAIVISATVVYALRNPEAQDTQSWLLFADQLNPGKIMIRKPFTKYYYSMPFNFPRNLDVYDIRVHEIARFYNFSAHHPHNPPPLWSAFAHKVVLNSDESVAILLFLRGQLSLIRFRKFPFWEGGLEVVEYAGGEDGDGRVDDVINYKGKILSVDKVGRVCVVDCSKSEFRVIVESTIAEPGMNRKRLVEYDGELYMVVRGGVKGRKCDGAKMFRVFKLHEKLERWIQVNCICGMVFCIGVDFSFYVSPQVLGGTIGANSIIYEDGSFVDYSGGVDFDTFNLRDLRSNDLEIVVWHMEQPCCIDVIGSYPGLYNVLWPPPAWFWPNDISKRLADVKAALDALRQSILAQNLKAVSKELSPLEQVVAADDDASHQSTSEIWKLEHTVKECLNKVRYIHNHIESSERHAMSMPNHDNAMNLVKQAGEIITEAEWRQASVNLLHSASETDDSCLSTKRTLNVLVLSLEECTTKLQDALKLYEQDVQQEASTTS